MLEKLKSTDEIPQKIKSDFYGREIQKGNMELLSNNNKLDFVSSKDSKQFYNISSFEKKINTELSRISRSYGKLNAISKFNNNLLEKYIEFVPDFENYRVLKILNNKEKYKFKLSPLIIQKKDGFDKLGNKFFDNLKYKDSEYYDINKECDDYLRNDKDKKLQEENLLNCLNFDFSIDYRKLHEENQIKENMRLTLSWKGSATT